MNQQPQKTTSVWVVDDDQSLRWVLQKAFEAEGMDVTAFEDAYEALEAFETGRPDVLMTDIRMPGIDGLGLSEKVHSKYPELPVIIMTAHSDLESAVSSYKTGAFDYLPKPFDLDEAVALVNKAKEASDTAQLESSTATETKPKTEANKKIIGESPAMQEVYRVIGRLAHSNITVLINGESGTGKELIAAALHEHSPRKNGPFIALNMAAIPSELIEAELFGHEKGAFTGAASQRKGRFEQASGGTLFLDEIGDMPFATQTRLLRVLADGEFYRVGGHTPVKVDVRVIAATHQNLEQRVQDGLFREDLFYRLNVIRLKLPSLRERSEDIPMLAEFFLQQAASEMGVEPKLISVPAMEHMINYNWPGNVRQLQNTCRWLTVMASSAQVNPEDLPPDINPNPAEATQAKANSAAKASSTQAVTLPSMAAVGPLNWHEALEKEVIDSYYSGNLHTLVATQELFEQKIIELALKLTADKKGEAAELLGWGRNTLTRKLKA